MATKKVVAKAKKVEVKKAVKKAAPAVKKVAKAKVAPKAKAAPKAKVKRTPNAKFMAPLTPSSALAEVIGAKPVPRTEAVKKVWVYIKKNDLQDKKNRRQINADAKLKAVLKKDKVTMFELAKLLSQNLK